MKNRLSLISPFWRSAQQPESRGDSFSVRCVFILILVLIIFFSGVAGVAELGGGETRGKGLHPGGRHIYMQGSMQGSTTPYRQQVGGQYGNPIVSTKRGFTRLFSKFKGNLEFEEKSSFETSSGFSQNLGNFQEKFITGQIRNPSYPWLYFEHKWS